MGVGILGQPDCRHHAALTAIASIGKEALRITVRAEAPAVDAPHAYGLQACARDGIEFEQPVPRARRHERLARLADCGSYILAHLVYARSDRRPEPGVELFGRRAGRLDGRLQHATREPAPTRVRG